LIARVSAAASALWLQAQRNGYIISGEIGAAVPEEIVEVRIEGSHAIAYSKLDKT
jgi:hypothetical protein